MSAIESRINISVAMPKVFIGAPYFLACLNAAVHIVLMLVLLLMQYSILYALFPACIVHLLFISLYYHDPHIEAVILAWCKRYRRIGMLSKRVFLP